MAYLILAIFSALSISMLVKDSEQKDQNREIVLASNYLSAAGATLAVLAVEGAWRFSPTTLALGAAGGILWPAAFFLQMRGIRDYGMALTIPVARMGLVVPVGFALLFLAEPLSLQVVVGLVVTISALWFISPIQFSAFRKLDPGAFWLLPLILLSFGFVQLWLVLFNAIGNQAEEFAFIAVIFLASAFFTILILALRRPRVETGAVRHGLLLGLPNFLLQYLLLQSLQSPVFIGRSSMVYILFSAIGMALTFVVGVIFWREQVTYASVIGLLLAIIAVTIFNL